MLRSCLVRSRGLGLYSTRACPSAFQLDWSRGFAGNAKGDEEKSPEQIYVDEQRTKEAEMLLKTQTLDAVSVSASYMVCPEVDEELPPGASIEQEHLNNHFPEEVLKDRTVRIFQRARNVMQSGNASANLWCIESDAKPRWNNMLMNYQSSADPIGQTGPRNLWFNSAEEAKNFATKMGFKYVVANTPRIHDFKEEKNYAHNFLNYHVRTRREKGSPRKLMKEQFGHKEGGKSTWVNLKHTPFGKKESKVTTNNLWSDPHPANHEATDWYMESLKAKQELARKLGK
uniref:NADH dehydrogenase [ubiquinone] iron-sulfur protein 4, mitochondrial n=1 Tax=Mucochytrium quahogii TaxID=96639 RepID=A0A7S2W1U9_9STRA|mmetsp:Transcript_6623/g.10431  ORF Transcript_6623/g.10431 Transcript_6623/m.10431 type:complete len:286 (+) Transcript_6623:104-961(+)